MLDVNKKCVRKYRLDVIRQKILTMSEYLKKPVWFSFKIFKIYNRSENMRNIEIKLEIGTLFTKPYGDGSIRTSNPRVGQRIDPLGHLVGKKRFAI